METKKKSYTLSEMIDFVTRGEDSSNVDSEEEESWYHQLLKELKPKPIATVISQMTNMKDLHNISLAVC